MDRNCEEAEATDPKARFDGGSHGNREKTPGQLEERLGVLAGHVPVRRCPRVRPKNPEIRQTVRAEEERFTALGLKDLDPSFQAHVFITPSFGVDRIPHPGATEEIGEMTVGALPSRIV